MKQQHRRNNPDPDFFPAKTPRLHPSPRHATIPACCDLQKLLFVDRYPLSNRIIIDQIRNGYGDILDGMSIWLYSPTFKNGKFDPSIFPGTIRRDNESGEMWMDAKEADMVYLSESEQFKDYTIEDVVGSERYRSLRDKNTKWF